MSIPRHFPLLFFLDKVFGQLKSYSIEQVEVMLLAVHRAQEAVACYLYYFFTDNIILKNLEH